MIFTFFIPAALLCKLSVEIHSSCALAMKQIDRLAIDTECKDCGKLFLHNCVHMINTGAVSTYARTACYALLDENRVAVTAVARPNMSTAAVEQLPAKRTRGKHE